MRTRRYASYLRAGCGRSLPIAPSSLPSRESACMAFIGTLAFSAAWVLSSNSLLVSPLVLAIRYAVYCSCALRAPPRQPLRRAPLHGVPSRLPRMDVTSSTGSGTGSAGVPSKRHGCFGKLACARSAGPPGSRVRRRCWRAARVGCVSPFRVQRPPVRAGDRRGRAEGRRRGPCAVHELRRRSAEPAGGSK